MQLRPAVRHAESGRPGCRGDLDRRRPGRTIRLRSGVLPAAQKLVPVLMSRPCEAKHASGEKALFQCAGKLLGSPDSGR